MKIRVVVGPTHSGNGGSLQRKCQGYFRRNSPVAAAPGVANYLNSKPQVRFAYP